jgi:hypothetical protein
MDIRGIRMIAATTTGACGELIKMRHGLMRRGWLNGTSVCGVSRALANLIALFRGGNGGHFVLVHGSVEYRLALVISGYGHDRQS